MIDLPFWNIREDQHFFKETLLLKELCAINCCLWCVNNQELETFAQSDFDGYVKLDVYWLDQLKQLSLVSLASLLQLLKCLISLGILMSDVLFSFNLFKLKFFLKQSFLFECPLQLFRLLILLQSIKLSAKALQSFLLFFEFLLECPLFLLKCLKIKIFRERIFYLLNRPIDVCSLLIRVS